jgi:RNA polymerase sigma-70 factor (ECF subfamily)
MIDWKQIVSLHGPSAWAAACRLLGNRHDAEDCVQDAFAAAVGIAAREPVLHWRALLRRLVTARAIDQLRERYRGKHEQAPDLSEVRDAGPSPSQHAEADELLEMLRKALVRLPRDQAQVVLLHCIEGCSHEEIGEQLSLSSGAVGMVLLRARARLKELFAETLCKRS